MKLFKRKTYLRDVISDGYVDIHSHILPGIDDGAKDIEKSIELIKSMISMGFGSAIATPHIMKNVWDNDRGIIENALETVKSRLREDKINFQVSAAAEYLMDNTFSESLGNIQLMTLKEKYVLVEMSYINPPIQLYQVIFDIQLAGYKPILAHPERYYFFHKKFDEYQKLKDSGCAFQLNLLSVVGYYGEAVAEIAKKLLKLGMIDYVGSDIHHSKHVASFGGKVLLKDMLPLKEAIERNSFFNF